MQILFVCADQRIVTSTTQALAGMGIEVASAHGLPDAILAPPQREDALVVWHQQLRRLARQRHKEAAPPGHRVPLIVAMRADDLAAIAEVAPLIDGIVFVDANLPRMAEIVRLARSGYLILPGAVAGNLLKWPTQPAGQASALSGLEADVLRALGEGLTNRQISRRLAVTESAAKHRVRDVLRKLHFENRTQAAIYTRFRRRGRNGE